MKPFSLLIKPASADCNLRCSYCFYLKKAQLYPDDNRHRMSDEVLERLIAGYMATTQPQYGFGWQGGEPTLMGVDFFRRVTALQQRYGRPGSVVANGLQTNATLIDDALASHLAEYKFLVGVSLDGPPGLHDIQRLNIAGQGSHGDVLKGIETLRRHQVEFNVLVLVSAANAGYAGEIYRYLKDLGIAYHQYIPCVEFDRNGELLPFSITGEAWGEFLCGIYDQWFPADTGQISVRFFDSILTMMVEGVANVCHMAGNCCQYFVVEYNGDVYPCDFFVDNDKRLGSISNDSWEALQASPPYRDFGRQKARWNAVCRSCPYLRYCSGDCLKHRPGGPAEPTAVSVLCSGWKRFFQHAVPGLEEIARRLIKERKAGGMTPPTNTLALTGCPGRNDLCPCGSGLKYKRCHGAA